MPEEHHKKTSFSSEGAMAFSLPYVDIALAQIELQMLQMINGIWVVPNSFFARVTTNQRWTDSMHDFILKGGTS